MTLKDFFIPGPDDDGDPVTGHFYEMASADPERPQVWGYTATLSHAPGEVLRLHAMGSAKIALLEIARDGLVPETVLRTAIALTFEPTPPGCSVTGCGFFRRLWMLRRAKSFLKERIFYGQVSSR